MCPRNNEENTPRAWAGRSDQWNGKTAFSQHFHEDPKKDEKVKHGLLVLNTFAREERKKLTSSSEESEERQTSNVSVPRLLKECEILQRDFHKAYARAIAEPVEWELSPYASAAITSK